MEIISKLYRINILLKEHKQELLDRFKFILTIEFLLSQRFCSYKITINYLLPIFLCYLFIHVKAICSCFLFA